MSAAAGSDGAADGTGAMGVYVCPVCDYVYDERRGAPREGFPAGTPWSAVPDDWTCPDCGVREKIDFEQRGGTAEAGE